MSINKIKFIVLTLSIMISACSSDTFVTHNGNMPTNDRISQVKVGDSKNFVLTTLGAPSSVVCLKA